MYNQNKGPLVRVELQPGRFVKMHLSDAQAKGLVGTPEAPRKIDKRGRENKLAIAEGIKATKIKQEQVDLFAELDEEFEDEPIERDDFLSIPGVGLATVELLHNQGVYTFDELRAADLSGLYYRAREAIELWRQL